MDMKQIIAKAIAAAAGECFEGCSLTCDEVAAIKLLCLILY